MWNLCEKYLAQDKYGQWVKMEDRFTNNKIFIKVLCWKTQVEFSVTGALLEKKKVDLFSKTIR